MSPTTLRLGDSFYVIILENLLPDPISLQTDSTLMANHSHSPVSAGIPTHNIAENSNVREKAAEILTSTLNGSLSELGYRPDLLQQLQTIHEWNIRLKTENEKLFQDNRKLAQLISMQNERLGKVAVPPSAVELQRRLQSLEMNRQELLLQHQRALDEMMVLRQEVVHLRRTANPALNGNPMHPPYSRMEMSLAAPIPQPPQNGATVPIALPGFFATSNQRRNPTALPAIDTSVAMFSSSRGTSSSDTRATPTSSVYARPISSRRTSQSITNTPEHDLRNLPYNYVVAPQHGGSRHVEMIDLTEESDRKDEEAKAEPLLNADPPFSDTIQDCIEANFVEQEEEEGTGRLWCRMCQSRHKAGFAREAPEPFVNVGREELVKHCEQEHPRGWELLKQSAQEQQESD